MFDFWIEIIQNFTSQTECDRITVSKLWWCPCIVLQSMRRMLTNWANGANTDLSQSYSRAGLLAAQLTELMAATVCIRYQLLWHAISFNFVSNGNVLSCVDQLVSLLHKVVLLKLCPCWKKQHRPAPNVLVFLFSANSQYVSLWACWTFSLLIEQSSYVSTAGLALSLWLWKLAGISIVTLIRLT